MWSSPSVRKDRFKVAALPPLPDKKVFEELKIYEHYVNPPGTQFGNAWNAIPEHEVGDEADTDRPNRTCHDRLKMDLFPEEVCVTNASAPKVLFFGDSHAMGLYSAIYPNLIYKPNGKEWGQNCSDIAQKGVAYARPT